MWINLTKYVQMWYNINNILLGDTKMDTLLDVGEFQLGFNNTLQTNFPINKIKQSSGLIKHIKSKHPNCLQYIPNIPTIISSPDYIGMNPNHPDSFELIKNLGNNVLLAIKLDSSNNYYFVASLYEITNQKLKHNLSNGRFKFI